ncbi:hypothetical protein [uncultured Brachyspira sp.]|uniref:hypothetical protein n=1 Tax=uncultured Brachyspira sp. TaxID=221953 RepID=UPI0026257005|nr:hypothetical protein [uncultured Brachyspira sp.]
MNSITANSKQQTANSKQQTANSKQQTANSKQQTLKILYLYIKNITNSKKVIWGYCDVF